VIVRYVVHIEGHRGYWPRLSIRRAPRHGDRTMNGGQPGTLVRCPECGEGFLHRPDTRQATSPAAPGVSQD
jgi:hypothetical protein